MNWKRIVLIAVVVGVVGGLGVFLWARSVLTGPAVRDAVAAQLTKALGEPVTIGELGVHVFPRITIDVANVQIGQPARITVGKLHIGTALGALLSKKIEHADLKLDGARIELPLPAFAQASASTPDASASNASAKPPVEIGSIDEIVLSGVELVAGGEALKGDIELLPHGVNALTVRKMALAAGATNFSITGEVTDVANATANLTMTAGTIDAIQLMTFVEKFSAAAAQPAAATTARASGPMNITVAMSADRLTFGALTLEKLGGTATVTPERVTIDQAKFGLFDGNASGIVTLGLDAASSFTVDASLQGVDVAKAVAFAGSPGALTGRASGTMKIQGQGVTADEVIKSTTGTVRLDAVDGTVKSLGLVKAIVVATSMRAGATSQLANTKTEEPFSRMGMSLAIANGIAHTNDLAFESPNILLNAAGDLKLDGTAVDLAGNVQLSDALTESAGRDLVRYTQKDGRVTVPVNVTGSPEALKVRVNVGDMAKTAIANKAKEEAKKGLLKGLGKIIKKN